MFIRIKSYLRALWEWLSSHWKLISSGFLLLLFFYPPAYPFVVRWIFPHSYYYLGNLGNPAQGFNDLQSWNVDMNWIDRAPPDKRWDRLATSQRQVAHLDDKSYVPGRSSPTGTSDEVPGKIWTGKQCLFIEDVTFVLIDVTGIDKDDDGRSEKDEVREIARKRPPNFAVGTGHVIQATGSELIAKFGRESPGELYKRELLRLADLGDAAGKCPKDGMGKRCSRIAIWANAAPAPCSIWPF